LSTNVSPAPAQSSQPDPDVDNLLITFCKFICFIKPATTIQNKTKCRLAPAFDIGTKELVRYATGEVFHISKLFLLNFVKIKKNKKSLHYFL